MTMTLRYAKNQHIGKRQEQEDTLIIESIGNQIYLCILADGMGGHTAGKKASETVCQGFVEYFESNPVEVSGNTLKLALDYANESIANILRNQPQYGNMGTTVIALLYDVISSKYAFVSVGDSPLYLFNYNGLQRINANHSYYEILLRMVAEGMISQADADNNPKRNAITSSVMGEPIPEIDIREGYLKADELLILASDGLQTLDDSQHGEIAEFIRYYHNDINQLSNSLIEGVLQKQHPKQDNTSLIIICPNSTKPQITQPLPSLNKAGGVLQPNKIDDEEIINTANIYDENPNGSEQEIDDGSQFLHKSLKIVSLILAMLICGVLGAFTMHALQQQKSGNELSNDKIPIDPKSVVTTENKAQDTTKNSLSDIGVVPSLKEDYKELKIIADIDVDKNGIIDNSEKQNKNDLKIRFVIPEYVQMGDKLVIKNDGKDLITYYQVHPSSIQEFLIPTDTANLKLSAELHRKNQKISETTLELNTTQTGVN